MSEASNHDKMSRFLTPTGAYRRWRVRRKQLETTLPPPGSGKALADLLDRIAPTLTPEDLDDLDKAIRASHERPH